VPHDGTATWQRSASANRVRFVDAYPKGNSMKEYTDSTSPGTLGRYLSRRAVLGRAVGASLAVTGTYGLFHSSVFAHQLGVPMTDATPITSPSPASPTVVLVHGAWADGSSWAAVIAELNGSGLTVVAPPNPLRGVAADAAYVASFVQQIAGPVLLVGHSYGGAVITNAASRVDNVVGLVYVAAFLPDAGETLGAISGQATDTLLGPALRPTQYPTADGAKPGTEFFIDRTSFKAVFCADVSDAQATVMAISQRPISELALGEATADPAWKTLPSWAVFGTADQAIGITALRQMAKRANANTVEVDGASHVVMVSQPTKVADQIRAALASVS
jgi:pimeloyl-ACP methyl ester carboxylesterase